MMNRRRSPQAGFTLIEVLVALLIFSFGLLGFVGLQARAIQYTVGAEDANRASLLANELAAQMVNAGTVALPAATVAAWAARASDPKGVGLPNGQASAAVNGNIATISLQWQPVNAASGASTAKYVTQVILP